MLKFFASFFQKRRQQQVENLIGNEVDGLDNLTRQIYEDGYYQTIFELQKGTGVTSSFAILDADKIKKVLSKPWASDGLNFSRRVWGQHRAELVQKLNTDFVQALIRGDDSQKLINKISSDFNVSKYKAGRLVMTESAFFATESQKDAFRELGVKYFSVSATFDRDTCSDCGYREGEKIPMDLYEVGVTAPPFHPNCRCDIVPEDTYGDIKSYRATRDKDGNYVEVPNDMFYAQWKNIFLDENHFTNSKNNDKIKVTKSKEGILLHTIGKLDKKKYQVISNKILTDDIVLTDKQVKHINERHPNVLSKYENKLLEIINNPDYIFLDPKHVNTALIIKRFSNAVEIVLKLSTDTLEKKNSIITMWEIKEKRLQRYLKKNKLLYKSE